MTHNTKAIDGKDEELRQLQSCLEEKGSENESLEEQLQELNKVVEDEKARAKEAVKKVVVESVIIYIDHQGTIKLYEPVHEISKTMWHFYMNRLRPVYAASF